MGGIREPPRAYPLSLSTHKHPLMEDTRCCGTGTCIINAEGYCWCGQRWNGERMCFPEPAHRQPGQESQDDKSSVTSADLPQG